MNRDLELSVIHKKRDEAGNESLVQEDIETRIVVGELQRVDDCLKNDN